MKTVQVALIGSTCCVLVVQRVFSPVTPALVDVLLIGGAALLMVVGLFLTGRKS